MIPSRVEDSGLRRAPCADVERRIATIVRHPESHTTPMGAQDIYITLSPAPFLPCPSNSLLCAWVVS